MARGGAREGAGRKKKFGVDTKTHRIPVDISERDVDGFVVLIQTLKQHDLYREGMTASEIIRAYETITN